MPWTQDTDVSPWVKGVNLALPGMATAFVVAMATAEITLRARLVSFISATIVASWTTLANTPAQIQSWTARLSAAFYLHQYQAYQLTPEVPDNPAAILYDAVMKEAKEAELQQRDILDLTGTAVPVTGPTSNLSSLYRDVDELPISAGGNKAI